MPAQTEDTKNRIFLTAARLFADHGYDKVSIREICEEAGVQKPTLYYYFKDKETLLLEMVNFSKEIGEQIYHDYVEKPEDFLEKIRGLIFGRKIFIEKYPQFFRFHAMIHLFAIPDSVKQEMIQYVLGLMRRFRKILEVGQKQGYVATDEDLDLLMMTLVSSLNHLTIRRFVFKDESALTDANLERLYRFWLKHFFSPKGA